MHVITIRLPDDLAAALKERKRRTDVPVEAFCRRAIREQLFKQVIDAEPEQPRQRTFVPVLISKAAE